MDIISRFLSYTTKDFSVKFDSSSQLTVPLDLHTSGALSSALR